MLYKIKEFLKRRLKKYPRLFGFCKRLSQKLRGNREPDAAVAKGVPKGLESLPKRSDSVCRLQLTQDGFLVDVTLNFSFSGDFSYKIIRDKTAVVPTTVSKEKRFCTGCPQPPASGQYLARVKLTGTDGKTQLLWSNRVEVFPHVFACPVAGKTAQSVIRHMDKRIDGCYFTDKDKAEKAL